jgi:hypothetical protein
VADPIVACVRTGGVYPFEYVTKLRNMVGRHMRGPYAFVCLTDQPERCEGALFIDIREVGLPGWWAKMLLFEPVWRGTSQIIFFDLDTVIIGDVSPLLGVPGEFAICESFTRLAGNSAYPCRYNSSCMVIGGGQCSFMWNKFGKRREYYIARHAAYGDQAAIEELYPQAAFLQNLMPKGFFANYRHLTMLMPKASVVNFGGRHKPHNCPIPWVKAAWV